ncbi:MAG: 2-dehydro-3-deoxygalactonokinase, partial [bacterium]
MTGEVYAALKDHTILGRLMKPGPEDEAAFTRGVTAAFDDPAGFLHRIFAARSLGLFGELAPESIASFLSGQVIGNEAAMASGSWAISNARPKRRLTRASRSASSAPMLRARMLG